MDPGKMSPSDVPILCMPNEILLLVFYQIPAIRDAVNFAQSCSHLYQLFSAPKNKIDILCSAANVPRKPNHSLDKAFSVLIRKPPSTWLLQSAQSSKYMLIEVDYGHVLPEKAAFVLWDLTAVPGFHQHATSPFQEIFEAFLTQFLDVRYILGNYYEPMTSDLISAAARLQFVLLRESDTVSLPVDLSADTTVIALALHCFAMVYPMDLISLYSSNWTEEELFFDVSPVIVLAPEDDDLRVLPVAKVHRAEYREDASLNSGRLLNCERKGEPRLNLDREFHRMLMHIIQVAFRLLDTQDPRHWPTVLYVLAILVIGVGDPLYGHQGWRRKMQDASRAFGHLVHNLARYYYLCTDGGQLLSSRWNKEEYATRVQHDQAAVAHAEILNRLWLETDNGNWDVEYSLEGFMAKLNYFVHGCAI